MSTSSEASGSPEADTLTRLQIEAELDDDDMTDIHDGLPPDPYYGSNASRLREWRTFTPRNRLTDQDMDNVFRPITDAATTPSKSKPNRWKAHQLRHAQHNARATKSKTKTTKAGTSGRASSDMGLFSLLPGELRNSIYRLAFVPAPEDQPVLVTGSDLICGRGACVHKRAPIAAPGMASTCRQIRNELMPIYCAENTFKLDAVMVRNRCAGNWVRALNIYARMVRKITLENLVLDRNLLVGGTDSKVCEIVVECPVGRKEKDGRFELVFDEGLPKEKVDAAGLGKVVEKLNDGVATGVGSNRPWMLGSEELGELVYRCRK